MLKVIEDLESVMVHAHGNQSEAARMLGVNRGSLANKVHAKENAYIVVENGDVYKRTGSIFIPEPMLAKE